jgi:acetate kinase
MILVWNAGSSSLKAKLYDIKQKRLVLLKSTSINRIGEQEIKNHIDATKNIIREENLTAYDIKTVAYRVVHSGGILEDGIVADRKILARLKKISDLAPLHNPPALESIDVSLKTFGKAKHKIFFDTSFFKDLPIESTTYPLPPDISAKYSIKKFGFHGISHEYAYQESGAKKTDRVVSIHLGAGCSATAINNGAPLETSMGLTPSGGLIMQSRTGDIDPGIVFHLIRSMDAKRAEELINKKSGLAGLTGTTGNMYDVLYLAGQKIEDANYLPPMSLKKDKETERAALLALRLYTDAIKRYIAGYAALMGGIDMVIFTGKIGACSNVIRNMTMNGLDFLKIKKVVSVDPDEEKAIAMKVIS